MIRSRLPLIFTVLLFSLMLLGNSSCSGDKSSDARDAQAVQAQQDQYAAAQPIPAFEFSLERDIVIQLYAARNEEVATHTLWRGDTSVIEGDCPSIGYPIPYDTSLTNPLRPVYRYRNSSSSAVTIEQPEPNGVYASKNSIATWVRCVVRGKTVPVYIEGKVTAYPYPIAVDYGTGRVSPAGAASVTIESRK